MTRFASAPAVSAPQAIAIGDLQGCFDCFMQLLTQIDAGVDTRCPQPARLWFCGDLVNRGPQSLATLRWAYQHRQRLVTVLGNHDLHLLATYCGVRKPSRSDTLDEILRADDCDQLIDWLRRQPLAYYEANHLLVHAGVPPQWSAEQTVALAGEVQQVLSGPDWREFMATMYGDEPRQWHDRLRGADRLRVIVNALTRMRFCSKKGVMEFATKEGAAQAPAGYLPWFEVPRRQTRDQTVVFGHWSTLGLQVRPKLLALDTGCVWGGALTAIRLSDRAQFQVGCPQASAPGPG